MFFFDIKTISRLQNSQIYVRFNPKNIVRILMKSKKLKIPMDREGYPKPLWVCYMRDVLEVIQMAGCLCCQ